jgi:hypothetical protein
MTIGEQWIGCSEGFSIARSAEDEQFDAVTCEIIERVSQPVTDLSSPTWTDLRGFELGFPCFNSPHEPGMLLFLGMLNLMVLKKLSVCLDLKQMLIQCFVHSYLL